MKKLISLILLVSVLSLSACGVSEVVNNVSLPPVPTSEPAEAEATAAPAPSEPVTETSHQHIIINFDKTELQAYDPQQGTELILSFSYETPYVHVPANVSAEETINEFIAMIDESFYTGDTYGLVYDSGCAYGYNNMLTMAEDNYNYIVNSTINFEGKGFELANHRTVSVERCDEELLTLLYHDYVNLGGVHGSYGYRAYNFDLKDGSVASLDSIAEDPEYLRIFLLNYMINAVDGDEELQQRMAGFVNEEGMPSLEDALAALIREGSWYFTEDGITIFSDLYELCSYAAGIIGFKIPYSELEGYIKAEYLPEETAGEAAFSVVPAEELRESSKEIIDMLKLQEDGQTVYLVAEGKARDVRISRVDYADGFYETERLWYCSEMEDCVLQLVTAIPEGMPELKLSYSDLSGEHVFYLSQSGVDGSLILVDEGIEAVG